MNSENQDNVAELVTRRKNCLTKVIASKILDNLKICMEYLPTLNVSEVDGELLQWIMPVMKKNIKKLYDDTSLLVDTADDDFILMMVKDNLKIILDFVSILKTVLEFILENSEINLCDVISVPVETAYIILSTFEHCKNSSEIHRNTFNAELLDIFRITQEVHLLLLRILESCNVGQTILKHSNESEILREVLDIICEISSSLSDLNDLKSMITNWKAYKGILQKFSHQLEGTIDLTRPVKYLESEIIKNLSSFTSLDYADSNSTFLVTRTTNIATFLTSVTLKIFHIFWKILEKLSEQLLIFCYSIYSFSPEYFQSQDCPDSVVNSVRSIFVTIEPFVYRLSNDHAFSKLIMNSNNLLDKLSFGTVKFLNVCLKGVIESDSLISDFRLDIILEVIFSCLGACFTEFFWDPNIFDNLVLNISGAVIIYNESYSKVELILLKNILQEDILTALLALDIWSLLLKNSTTQLCLDTLNVLIDKYEELNFGINTQRLESVFLKHMIQRIFRMLPDNVKIEVIEKFGTTYTDKLKIISLHEFPPHQKHLIANLCANTVEKIDQIGSDTFSLKDLVYIGENFEVLSTAKFQDLGLDVSNLVNAVTSIWEPAHTDFNNNVLEYFIIKLCKITRTLILEFNTQQLFIILNQLNVLSLHDSFKLQVCNILHALSDKNTNDFGQEDYKIFALLANICYPNLINSSSNVIKQNVLEVIDSFFNKNKHKVVSNIMRASTEIQGELSNYLHRNVATEKFDKEYFNMLHNLKYVHKCMERRNEICHVNKKIKISDTIGVEEKEVNKVQIVKPSNPPNKIDEEQDDNVSEAIATLRTDVKYLVNLLKTEKLDKKNVSDLKLVANQLLSLM